MRCPCLLSSELISLPCSFSLLAISLIQSRAWSCSSYCSCLNLLIVVSFQLYQGLGILSGIYHWKFQLLEYQSMFRPGIMLLIIRSMKRMLMPLEIQLRIRVHRLFSDIYFYSSFFLLMSLSLSRISLYYSIVFYFLSYPSRVLYSDFLLSKYELIKAIQIIKALFMNFLWVKSGSLLQKRSMMVGDLGYQCMQSQQTAKKTVRSNMKFLEVLVSLSRVNARMQRNVMKQNIPVYTQYVYFLISTVYQSLTLAVLRSASVKLYKSQQFISFDIIFFRPWIC